MPKDALRIFHLFPRHMNLYGDLGNIIALTKRLEWRGLPWEVVGVNPGDHPDFRSADLLFLGGGQDRGQKLIAGYLEEMGPDIKREVEEGLPALTICGGYQLFGHYFLTMDGDTLPGISVFDAHTEGGSRRCIGNLVAELGEIASGWARSEGRAGEAAALRTLVGFENHSGLTYLHGDTAPLAQVVVGMGNLGDGGGEGAVYKNVIGTYLHGSLLPKNPHVTDHLLTAALERHSRLHPGPTQLPLAPLDDSVELRAHAAALERAHSARTAHLFQS